MYLYIYIQINLHIYIQIHIIYIYTYRLTPNAVGLGPGQQTNLADRGEHAKFLGHFSAVEEDITIFLIKLRMSLTGDVPFKAPTWLFSWEHDGELSLVHIQSQTWDLNDLNYS